ncbi:DUF4265 domain-containing protein [Pontibacter sp. SGAir0037]|uniref:DUF4265 domain-containing protein n=1 Tax=Pontibacter sp. SGAir0037 TaxID=2571030 RepID=UPI0010CCFE55|nr:DUF4265 domain-containing protein [Pontibacter sp. SGAir0037]QCR21466.1 hypothetical protein C1N53_03290 [Pontibacter sp. SGAir0037]
MKKIIFKFWNDILDEDYVERVWAEPIDEEKGHYKIDNIPYFVTSYSDGDVVRVENEFEELVVKELIKPSGNTTINIIFFECANKQGVLDKLTSFGCEYEGMENFITGYYSVNVPEAVDYKPIYKLLNELELAEQLSFREA